MKTRRKLFARLTANFLTAFLSPLLGASVAFNLPINDDNLKILITALIASVIVTGLVLAREFDNYGKKGTFTVS